jgi:GT2 family glycosyltransferase
MEFERSTLIISVYNNTTALKAVLDSVQQQTVKPDEVIVSEDAMHDSMKRFIADYPFNGKLIHFTQPDVGWQKNIALNKAIKASTTDYLIFIDGDCVLHPRFIEFHLKKSNSNTILGGKRIKLDEESSNLLISGKLTPQTMNSYVLNNYSTLKSKGAKFIEEGVFIRPGTFLGFIPQLRGMTQLKGCNMSFPKKAIVDINGFDEDYTKPAIGEDIDLTWRFVMAGYKLKSLRNTAVQYHLYHKENWTDQTENKAMMQQKMAIKQYVCINGLAKNFVKERECRSGF